MAADADHHGRGMSASSKPADKKKHYLLPNNSEVLCDFEQIFRHFPGMQKRSLPPPAVRSGSP